MVKLNNRIASLEMRAEQLRIHLQSLSRQSGDAEQGRSRLYVIMQELTELKAERERREAELEIA